MGCPVHIWVPAMAALAPAARIARERVRLFRASRHPKPSTPVREMRRFAPISPNATSTRQSPPEV